MYAQNEHRERLKQEAKNMLFEAEFNRQVEEQIAKKQSNKGKSLADATLARSRGLGKLAKVHRHIFFTIHNHAQRLRTNTTNTTRTTLP